MGRNKMLRTHTCGELRKEHKDQTVVLCGWVHRRRDHGKLIFIDIRDRYGITQVVFVPSVAKDAHAEAQKLGPEFVVKLTGKVNVRPPKNVNAEIPTGEIELTAEGLEILNTSKTPAFEVAEETEVGEDVRLTYRYLDLRRPKLLNALTLRSKLCAAIRQFLNQENFMEVETPVLTKSTPEGARDFLVPSRLVPGSFFALPQSPQLFKQILMVSGFDRYYQIVKCFRDEDLRADRQPEFTQLDMEMSFVDEEDVFALTERLFKMILKETKGIDIQTPFPRMTHAEAMAKYKSDKPDIRKSPDEFAFLWVVDFPMFKYNEEERRWESEHHPFTSMKEDDLIHLEKGEFKKIRARSYDLVLNGNEIGSGSVRIHRREMQQKVFETIGIGAEEAQERFGFLLRAFEYGAPPHAGVAYGIDRLVTILSGLDSIRDVIAFPKTQSGSCLMTQAPSVVDQKQLKELGVMTIREVNHG
ncbi:MAG: aspartate--tRNA ligase [Candidatus Omnitrophica bacterium]|nr:aspartate--tRNA ligase [Candidatus Omnitrophota bacterium]